MTDNKHTPGPWLRDKSSGYSCDVRASNGRRIAAVNVQNPPRSTAAHDVRKVENEANACLIAAAPDLLAALKTFVAEYVELVESGDAGFWNAEEEAKVIAARAAIAKAEGSSAA